MCRFRLAFVLPAAALFLALATKPLLAQDNNDGLLRRGPHGQRPQMNQPSPTPQPTPEPSSLPATQPTTLPAPVTTAAITPSAVTDLHHPPTTRARVIYADSQLEVRADNSSLLQILHDISRETRMAITGGVADQRIFGDYGPGSPATILATLLDGTGTNMLLQQDPFTAAPIKLVLSQRAGAAPPASPNGSGFDDSPFSDDVPPPHASQPMPASVLSQPQPPDPDAPRPTNYVPGSPFNAPNPPPPSATLTTVTDVPAVTAPAGPAKPSTSTPESIYQQLLQMQQAKASAAQSTTPPAVATPAPASSTTPPKQ